MDEVRLTGAREEERRVSVNVNDDTRIVCVRSKNSISPFITSPAYLTNERLLDPSTDVDVRVVETTTKAAPRPFSALFPGDRRIR